MKFNGIRNPNKSHSIRIIAAHSFSTMKRRRLLDDDHQRNNNNKYIPIDITAEILSRLPIKSIGRFISVSKSWRDIVTCRPFSSLHAKNKPFSTLYSVTPRSLYDSKHYVFEVDEDGNSVTTTFRPRIDDDPSEKLQVVGSCNGLLCLLESQFGSDAITILNPITNEKTVVTLPNHGDWILGLSEQERHSLAEFHRFCYSPSTNEYKVFKSVTIPYRTNFRGAHAIFTLGVDRRWRALSPNLFSGVRMNHDDDAVFCNGALHWLIDNDDPSSNHILAFDVAGENTRRMPIHQEIKWQTVLSVFENRISLYKRWLEQPNQGDVVWNMEGSWSRVVVPIIRGHKDDKEVFEPLHCATKYGDVLLEGRYCGHVWLYCPKRKRQINIGVAPFCTDRLFEFTPTFSSIEEILHGGESSKQCV